MAEANSYNGDSEPESDNEVEVIPPPNIQFNPLTTFRSCEECDEFHPLMWHCQVCEWTAYWHTCCECCQIEGPFCEKCQDNLGFDDSDADTVPYGLDDD